MVSTENQIVSLLAFAYLLFGHVLGLQLNWQVSNRIGELLNSVFGITIVIVIIIPT